MHLHKNISSPKPHTDLRLDSTQLTALHRLLDTLIPIECNFRAPEDLRALTTTVTIRRFFELFQDEADKFGIERPEYYFDGSICNKLFDKKMKPNDIDVMVLMPAKKFGLVGHIVTDILIAFRQSIDPGLLTAQKTMVKSYGFQNWVHLSRPAPGSHATEPFGMIVTIGDRSMDSNRQKIDIKIFAKIDAPQYGLGHYCTHFGDSFFVGPLNTMVSIPSGHPIPRQLPGPAPVILSKLGIPSDLHRMLVTMGWVAGPPNDIKCEYRIAKTVQHVIVPTFILIAADKLKTTTAAELDERSTKFSSSHCASERALGAFKSNINTLRTTDLSIDARHSIGTPFCEQVVSQCITGLSHLTDHLDSTLVRYIVDGLHEFLTDIPVCDSPSETPPIATLAEIDRIIFSAYMMDPSRGSLLDILQKIPHGVANPTTSFTYSPEWESHRKTVTDSRLYTHPNDSKTATQRLVFNHTSPWTNLLILKQIAKSKDCPRSTIAHGLRYILNLPESTGIGKSVFEAFAKLDTKKSETIDALITETAALSETSAQHLLSDAIANFSNDPRILDRLVSHYINQTNRDMISKTLTMRITTDPKLGLCISVYNALNSHGIALESVPELIHFAPKLIRNIPAKMDYFSEYDLRWLEDPNLSPAAVGFGINLALTCGIPADICTNLVTQLGCLSTPEWDSLTIKFLTVVRGTVTHQPALDAISCISALVGAMEKNHKILSPDQNADTLRTINTVLRQSPPLKWPKWSETDINTLSMILNRTESVLSKSPTMIREFVHLSASLPSEVRENWVNTLVQSATSREFSTRHLTDFATFALDFETIRNDPSTRISTDEMIAVYVLIGSIFAIARTATFSETGYIQPMIGAPETDPIWNVVGLYRDRDSLLGLAGLMAGYMAVQHPYNLPDIAAIHESLAPIVYKFQTNRRHEAAMQWVKNTVTQVIKTVAIPQYVFCATDKMVVSHIQTIPIALFMRTDLATASHGATPPETTYRLKRPLCNLLDTIADQFGTDASQLDYPFFPAYVDTKPDIASEKTTPFHSLRTEARCIINFDERSRIEQILACALYDETELPLISFMIATNIAEYLNLKIDNIQNSYGEFSDSRADIFIQQRLARLQFGVLDASSTILFHTIFKVPTPEQKKLSQGRIEYRRFSLSTVPILTEQFQRYLEVISPSIRYGSTPPHIARTLANGVLSIMAALTEYDIAQRIVPSRPATHSQEPRVTTDGPIHRLNITPLLAALEKSPIAKYDYLVELAKSNPQHPQPTPTPIDSSAITLERASLDAMLALIYELPGRFV